MMEYYPPRTPTMATLNREIPGFNAVDHLEEQRLVWSALPRQASGITTGHP